jgi:glycine/D-amino acid oxidase-like deaminating enzyme
VILCPGANPSGGLEALPPRAAIRRVRLQMMQTVPLRERLTTAVADAGSLRYYPVFDVPSAVDLPAQDEASVRLRIQLLIAQRAGGELTIGDTHEYDEPFDFAQDQGPYEELRRRAESLLGRPLPPVARTWSGVYLEAGDGGICVREEVAPGVTLVTGAGGRGMTLAPAIAEATIDGLVGAPA